MSESIISKLMRTVHDESKSKHVVPRETNKSLVHEVAGNILDKSGVLVLGGVTIFVLSTTLQIAIL